MIEVVRVSEIDRDMLVRLKRSTGLKNWNVLCRWAFTISLADTNPTSIDPIGENSNIEMTWKVFGGVHADIYLALLRQRVGEDYGRLTDDLLERELARHIHRGIGKLLNISQKPTLVEVTALAK